MRLGKSGIGIWSRGSAVSGGGGVRSRNLFHTGEFWSIFLGRLGWIFGKLDLDIGKSDRGVRDIPLLLVAGRGILFWVYLMWIWELAHPQIETFVLSFVFLGDSWGCDDSSFE